jgi:hypothetical protein
MQKLACGAMFSKDQLGGLERYCADVNFVTIFVIYSIT